MNLWRSAECPSEAAYRLYCIEKEFPKEMTQSASRTTSSDSAKNYWSKIIRYAMDEKH